MQSSLSQSLRVLLLVSMSNSYKKPLSKSTLSPSGYFGALEVCAAGMVAIPADDIFDGQVAKDDVVAVNGRVGWETEGELDRMVAEGGAAEDKAAVAGDGTAEGEAVEDEAVVTEMAAAKDKTVATEDRTAGDETARDEMAAAEDKTVVTEDGTAGDEMAGDKTVVTEDRATEGKMVVAEDEIAGVDVTDTSAGWAACKVWGLLVRGGVVGWLTCLVLTAAGGDEAVDGGWMEMARGGNGGTGGGELGAGRIDRESGEGKVKRLEGEEGREEDVSGSKMGEEVC
jgi:hypothetical protein